MIKYGSTPLFCLQVELSVAKSYPVAQEQVMMSSDVELQNCEQGFGFDEQF